MAKIYLFCIGGTGSRVLRSLTMMMAAGVEIGADEIVPIIVDPDHSNADLTRTISLLNDYSWIRQFLNFGPGNANRFFRTEITQVTSDYRLRIEQTDNHSFQEFIEYASMSKANQALVGMLFSDKNLRSSMDVGFKGNPNIGSVVLNQIGRSADFESFANSFSEGDRIFIVSSIFGGTGASGFPLLLKTLRTGDNFPNHSLINQATIGAVTILPYFKVKVDDKSEIDSSTFISKTKSALAYYENNICGPGAIDELYYLADDVENIYDNHEGGSAQQNDAHLIEFLGATAIAHFSNSSAATSSHLQTKNWELGIKETDGAVSFHSFHPKLFRMLYGPLVQFTLMANALTHHLAYYRSGTFNANKGNFEDFYSCSFFNELRGFLDRYREWLQEMRKNKRPLDLFFLECGNKPFELVVGRTAKRRFSLYSDYDLFTARLNGAIKECQSRGEENKFLEMFYLGTLKLVKEKLSN